MEFIIGIYLILGSHLVYFIKKYKHPYLIIFLMTTLSTMLELIYVYFEMVIYNNGWSGIHTFFSYLFPYILAYRYYLFLEKTVNSPE